MPVILLTDLLTFLHHSSKCVYTNFWHRVTNVASTLFNMSSAWTK